MVVRAIRLFGDPVLRSATDPVDPRSEVAHTLVADLLDTVKEPGRAGVAANQIGVGLRAFSFNVDGEVGYFLNPVLVEVSGEPEEMDEGCLSVPGMSFPRKRYPEATVRGETVEGETITVSASGLLAQAFQHECDHLDGHLYIEGLESPWKAEAMRQVRDADWFQR